MLTEKQKELLKKHGSLDKFEEDALCCPDISYAEAWAAILKYRQEWAEAGKTTDA